MCLLAQLLRQLIHFCIELVRDHIAECQKLRRRSREDWFFEFPDARPPLSTTWPWAIKPSLAVLWGVCWMFFGPLYWDKDGNLLDSQGNIQVSRSELDHWLLSDPAFMNGSAPQQTPERGVANTHNNIPGQMSSAGPVLYRRSAAYPPAHLSAPTYQMPPQMPPRLMRDGSHLPASAMMATTQPQTRRPLDTQPRQPSSRVHSAFGGESRRSPFCLSYREANSKAAGPNQAPASYSSLAVQAGTNTAYSAQPTAAHAGPVADGSWLPQDANFHHHTYLEQQQQDPWRWQEQNHTSQGLRPVSYTHLTLPTKRIV